MKKEFYLMLVKNIKIFILIVFLFVCCNSNKIDNETLVKVFVEKLIIDETYFKDENLLNQRRKELFIKYKITEKDFEIALNEIMSDIKKNKDFFIKSNQLLYDLKNSGAIN